MSNNFSYHGFSSDDTSESSGYESPNTSEEAGDTYPLPDRVKWAIITQKKMHASNKKKVSNRKIAREVGEMFERPTLSHTTIAEVWDKFSRTGDVAPEWSHVGRTRVMTEMEEEKLIEHCLDNRKDSARQYKEDLELEASRRTVSRYLTMNGLNSYRAPAKIKLKPRNKLKRLQFALDHRNWREGDWESIVFSDECRFNLIMPNGRMLVRRTANETLDDDLVQPYASRSKGISVWGAISSDGVGPLFKMEVGTTLDGPTYVSILKYRLKKNFPGLEDG